MSLAFGTKITHDNGSPRKCRIPQRVCSGTHRPLAKSRDIPRVSPMSENGRKIPKQNDTDGNNITASHRILCQGTPEQKIPSDSGVNPEKHTPKEEINELDSTKAKIDPIGLKESWKVKKEQFDKMRNDLNERQGTIMEVYADLKTAEEELALLGQKLSSRAIGNDLQIMNVAKLTPRQLLELCCETKACSPDVADKEDLAAAYFNIDVKKISNIPSKVFKTCEEMLKKHMELIELIENLKLNKNDLFHSKNGRVKDFKDEYDALKDKVQAAKTELDKDLVELTDVIRKCVKETMAVSLRNKHLTSELSRLKNSLPPKPINDKDHVYKQHPNKIKIEELEKKFKEEQLKNLTTKERLKKFESEAKINENRAIRLEVALEQAREENRVLKRTIQNQQDQNQQSQKEFNEELCKLNDLIEENSKNLEKIAEAKTKLQNEKKELDTQLKTVLEEKIKLQKITETQQSQFVKKDEQYKQTIKMLQDTQVELAEALKDRGDTTKVSQVKEKDLEKAKAEIINLNKKIAEKNKLIQNMKQRLDVTKTLEDQLRYEIEQKAKHIEDQENKCGLLEDMAKESEVKMQFYEKQIMTLEEEIKNVQNNYYKEKGNLINVNSMVTEQKQKIQELTQRNDELKSSLHNQAIELKTCTHTVLTQEEHIKEKDALISELSENKTKQTSIIESLQRDLVSKVNKIDSKVNGNLSEIECLIVDIRTKENRISEMEKVMIALYDQARKTKSKNKKYREKINILKQVILGYETYRDNVDLPSDYLDSLLKILENEVEKVVYVPSGRHNFERDFLNKRRKLFHSEAERAPRILIQNDRSSSRAGPLNDGHSDQDLRVTLQ